MPEQRAADGLQLRDRIDRYLRESGLGALSARVVPLTGDASDRRYFRVIASERRGMPTLRELKEVYSFEDLMNFHATLDALEDAEAEAKKRAEAQRPRK